MASLDRLVRQWAGMCDGRDLIDSHESIKGLAQPGALRQAQTTGSPLGDVLTMVRTLPGSENAVAGTGWESYSPSSAVIVPISGCRTVALAMMAGHMAGIHITDIEAAINHWRAHSPVGEDLSLSPPLQTLAEVYALLIYHHQSEVDEFELSVEAKAAWMAWVESQPDTPCIAICSTSQGDEVCKGCGRYFEEVQRWTEMSPAEKRITWRRITLEGDSWRFNRYAERALEAPSVL